MRAKAVASERGDFFPRDEIDVPLPRNEGSPKVEALVGRNVRREMRVLAWPAPSPSQSNPYISLVYSAFAKELIEIEPYTVWRPHVPRTDVFHVHWPEAILWGRLAHHVPLTAQLAAHRVLAAMDAVRQQGGTVAWTVHNLAPHHSSPRHARTWDWFFPQFRTRVDTLIGLSSRSLELVCERYPELQTCRRTVVPHPHYRTVYPAPFSVAQARVALGLPTEAHVVAIIGGIRRSKGIPRAIAAFRATRKHHERLLIAGHCADVELEAEIENAVGNDPAIAFKNAYLPDSELVSCFAAADVVVINQRSTLNSGTLMLALSMDRPVIAPAQGSIVELAEALGPSWISLFSGDLTSQALRDCIDHVRSSQRTASAPIDRFDPEVVSRATIAALRDSLAHRHAREAG